MSKQTLDVTGMQCAGCENVIQSELESVRGVQRVEADHREGVVEVVADTGSTDDVIETLEGLGYEAEA